MKYRRYGKFYFSDYISTWFAIAFLFVLVVDGFFTDIKFYLLIWPLLFIFIMAWSIYKPNREYFCISGDTITIIQGRKKHTVSIPVEPTFIVSYADVSSPLAKRLSRANQTYILKGRYAISILQKLPLETVVERLHKNHTSKYMTSTVEECFNENSYVYSFVCNQEILDKLLSDRNCQIIIPESIRNQISIDLQRIKVHIDTGY